jgi:cysteine synthase
MSTTAAIVPATGAFSLSPAKAATFSSSSSSSSSPSRPHYRRYTELIGNTPLIDLGSMLPEHVRAQGVRLLGKAEFLNPGFSMKDRIIARIFDSAEKAGKLVPGQVVVCASSGNTGAACAMICAARGR